MDKSMLARALADTEEPTPGYMYRDIVKWTFLDVKTQGKLISALMDRLKPNATVHVLTKTLKMIRHLCENGHTDFQKEMQGKNDVLKQFANYRGSQDAKYGDKLNERVRQAAKEAVDSAFAPRKQAQVNIGSGMGSNTEAHDSKQEKGSGFTTGNTVNTGGKSGDSRIADMPTGNKWAEHMARGGGPVKEDNAGGWGSQIKNAVTSRGGLVKEHIKSKEERMNEKLHDTGEYQAIDIGGGFGGGGGFDLGGGNSGSKSGGSSEWKFTAEDSSAPTQQEVRMITPLQSEVEKVAGFKNTPQRVEVSNFCETVANIVQGSGGAHTYEDLAEAMDAQISQKKPWQTRLNVLCCIEGVARSKVSEEFNSYFQENPEDIQRNMHVVQGSLKERAQKVLKLLNIPERTAGAGTTVAQQVTTSTNHGETTWMSPSTSAPKTEETGNAGADPLDFGDMTETAPRRGKKAGKATGEKTTLKKRSAMVTAQDDNSGGGWGDSSNTGGGWGDSNTGGGWGDSSAQDASNAGGGWGDSGTTGGADAWGASPSTTEQAPPQAQAPAPAPAQTSSNPLDDLLGGGPSPAPSANQTQQQQPAWGSSAPAPTPAWGSDPLASTAPTQKQPAQSSTFDPLSLPAPNSAPTPQQQAPAQGGGNNLAMQQQMMTQLNTQMQQLMATASTNPNAQQQMQMLMQQQNQLIQMMQASQHQAPASLPAQPTAQQQYQQQQMQQKKADDQFAFAAQQMKQSLKK